MVACHQATYVDKPDRSRCQQQTRFVTDRGGSWTSHVPFTAFAQAWFTGRGEYWLAAAGSLNDIAGSVVPALYRYFTDRTLMHESHVHSGRLPVKAECLQQEFLSSSP
jgi:hypothetical protein